VVEPLKSVAVIITAFHAAAPITALSLLLAIKEIQIILLAKVVDVLEAVQL
jgi:hypothetical protein